jgi:hypothetical protein
VNDVALPETPVVSDVAVFPLRTSHVAHALFAVQLIWMKFELVSDAGPLATVLDAGDTLVAPPLISWQTTK